MEKFNKKKQNKTKKSMQHQNIKFLFEKDVNLR